MQRLNRRWSSRRAERPGGAESRRLTGSLSSPLQPLRLQPLAEILIMFDSCFTYENRHKSPAFLPPTSTTSTTSPTSTTSACFYPGDIRLEREQAMCSKKGRAGCRQRDVKKEKKYGGIMRRVILSDSRSDFIKVIIAERKPLTYRPPPPPPHVAEVF